MKKHVPVTPEDQYPEHSSIAKCVAFDLPLLKIFSFAPASQTVHALQRVQCPEVSSKNKHADQYNHQGISSRKNNEAGVDDHGDFVVHLEIGKAVSKFTSPTPDVNYQFKSFLRQRDIHLFTRAYIQDNDISTKGIRVVTNHHGQFRNVSSSSLIS